MYCQLNKLIVRIPWKRKYFTQYFIFYNIMQVGKKYHKHARSIGKYVNKVIVALRKSLQDFWRANFNRRI